MNILSNYPKVKLGELCNIQIGKTPSRSIPEFFGKGHVWVSISDLGSKNIIYHSKEEITDLGILKSGIRLVEIGTVLFSFKLSIGKVAFAGKNLYTNEAIAALNIKSQKILFPKYLFYVMREIDHTGESDNAAMGKTLNKAKLLKLEIPLPPLPIQKKIAEVLDKGDAIRQRNRQILEKYDQLAESLFLEMFGDSRLNPKNLPIMLLNKAVNQIIDCPHSTPKFSEVKTDFPCIRTSEIKTGKIDWKSMKYLNAIEYEKRIKRLKPKKGDVIYGREGSFGDAIIVPDGINISLGQRVMLFRPDYNILTSEYFHSLIRSKGVYYQALKYNAGSTVGHVNIKDIKNFKLPIPPLEHQKNFSEKIAEINNIKADILNESNMYENLFQSLLQKAFKGKLFPEEVLIP